MMRQSKDPRYLRFELVRYATEHGVKPAARTFQTTPKTVRKWLQRWTPGTLDGLQEHSRAPHHQANAVSPEHRQQVIDLKKRLPTWGAQRLKRDYNLPLSEKAILKIYRQEGKTTRKPPKHRTKQDLRAVKARWRLFEQIDIDTKDLNDIPEFWTPARLLQLPSVQYTARDVVSGLQFIAYAQERSLICATLFVTILLKHLQRCGVSLKNCRVQTDNGSEFIGAWNAATDSSFTRAVQAINGLKHVTIPPRAHTWQADVETVHALIEDEFYRVEAFTSRRDFINKAAAYVLWFNVARTNSYKKHKTPWQILTERNPKINPQVVALPPVVLDKLWQKNLASISKRGYDVIPHP
jgi:transposase